MPKCVKCAVINQDAEVKRHKNPTTQSVLASLQKRLNNMSWKSHPTKFCRFHGGVGCTGRPSKGEAENGSFNLLNQDASTPVEVTA